MCRSDTPGVLAWPLVKPERRELKAGGLAPAPPAEGEARPPVPGGTFLPLV